MFKYFLSSMLSVDCDYFKFDKTFNFYIVLQFEKQVNRYSKYQEIKDIVKYSNYAYQIESGIFEFSVSYVIYNKIEYSNFPVYYNFQFNNIKYNLIHNPKLINNFKNNSLNPYNVAFMKPDELNNEKWKDIKDKMKKIKDKIDNVPTSNVYKCFKCGMRKVTTFQVQTRGQDEDATTFVKCHNCGNVWRE